MIAFLTHGPAGGHRMIVGGLTVLERRVRELAKAGAERVVVASEPVPLPALAVPVEFVAPGSAPPDGAQVEAADVVAGVHVVDARSRKDAEWALLRRMNKAHEGPVDALINWRFSMRITRQLARTPVRPNHVTVFSILLGLSAGWLASRSGYVAVAVAGVMMQLNNILDSCDGELARLRFQFSKLGQWLDNLSDDIVDNVFPIGVGVGLGGAWFWLGLAAACGRWLLSLYVYADVYRRTGTGDVFAFRWFFERDKATAVAVYDPTKVTTWLRSLGRRDTFVFLWFVACVVGFPQWVIGHAVGIAAVQLTMLLLQLTVYRERPSPS